MRPELFVFFFVLLPNQPPPAPPSSISHSPKSNSSNRFRRVPYSTGKHFTDRLIQYILATIRYKLSCCLHFGSRTAVCVFVCAWIWTWKAGCGPVCSDAEKRKCKYITLCQYNIWIYTEIGYYSNGNGSQSAIEQTCTHTHTPHIREERTYCRINLTNLISKKHELRAFVRFEIVLVAFLFSTLVVAPLIPFAFGSRSYSIHENWKHTYFSITGVIGIESNT